MSSLRMLASTLMSGGKSTTSVAPSSLSCWSSFSSRARFKTFICYRSITSLMRGTVADSISSICVMYPCFFKEISSLKRRRISRSCTSLSPPILSPVTAKSTSEESTASELACDPYCLIPTGTITCFDLLCDVCCLGSNNYCTIFWMRTMTDSRSLCTDSSLCSKRSTSLWTSRETIE